jgi:hypothetical protein
VRKALVVSAIAVVAIMVSMIGTSKAAGDITNSDIATGAVNSRTILDGGIYNRDIHTGAVNTTSIRDNGIYYGDLASSAKNALQNGNIRSGVTVRGVIGGDFDTPTGTTCADNCDWAGYASLPFPAPVGLGDDDVLVDASLWTTGGGQTAPTVDASTESTSSSTCTGTLATPTAPPGKVCIYVAGGDNASGLKGVSVMPGTGTSRYGFKLVWSSNTDEDTFIDAVWAYTAP